MTVRRLLKRAAFGAVLRSPLAHFSILPHPKINRRTPIYASGSNTTTETARPLRPLIHPIQLLANPSKLALIIQVPTKAKSGCLLVEPLTQRYLKAACPLSALFRLFIAVCLFSFSSDSFDASPFLQAFARSHSFNIQFLSSALLFSYFVPPSIALSILFLLIQSTLHVSVSTCQ